MKGLKVALTMVAVCAATMLQVNTVKADITPIGTAEFDTVYDLEGHGTDGVWYEISLPKTGKLTYTGECEGIEYSWNKMEFKVLDASGELLSMGAAPAGENAIFSSELLAGTYYVGATAPSGAQVDYKGKVKFSFKESTETVADSTLDAHNSVLTAAKFSGKSVNGILAINDRTDCFEYKAKKDCMAKITFATETLSDSYIKIFNADGGMVCEKYGMTIGTNAVSVALKKGTYYISVCNDDKNKTGAYKLGISESKIAKSKITFIKPDSTYGMVYMEYVGKEGADGYVIEYSTSSKFKKAQSLEVDNYYNCAEIYELKGKKTYYFRIKVMYKVGDDRVYSSWSKSVKTKI